MRLAAVGLTILCLAAAARSSEPPAEKTFHLTNYVSGTPAEIRRTLQGPVEEFTEKAKEARRRAAEAEAALSKAQNGALARARGTREYRGLAAAAARAEAQLQASRRSGTVQQRLDAGAALNRLRGAMEKLERDALASDKDVARCKASLAEERQSVARCEASLKKAKAWRDQIVYAVECTYRMNEPLRPGAEGALPTVKVIEPPAAGRDGVLVEYEAPQRKDLGDEAEGIRTVIVDMVRERLLLPADTPGAAGTKPGDVLELQRVYRIDALTTDADGTVYVAARQPADVDALLEAVIPLRRK
jgi:hypothetical protein